MFSIKESFEFINLIMSTTDLSLQQRLNITENEKRNLRRKLKPFDTDPFKETYHCRDERGESYYIKEFFDKPFTEEEKEEFVENQWRRIHSAYDCTGLAFTTSIRICNFKEPNSFGAMSVVYHFLALDV